jgi:hypothetical protein
MAKAMPFPNSACNPYERIARAYIKQEFLCALCVLGGKQLK